MRVSAVLVLFMMLVAATLLSAQSGGKKSPGDSGSARTTPLEGVWRGHVLNTQGGNDVAVEISIKGDKVTGKAKGEPQGGGTLKMTGEVKGAMDLVGTEGTQRGSKYAGIYELEGDTLKWCLSTNVRRRPKEMATKNGNYMLVLKRQK